MVMHSLRVFAFFANSVSYSMLAWFDCLKCNTQYRVLQTRNRLFSAKQKIKLCYKFAHTRLAFPMNKSTFILFLFNSRTSSRGRARLPCIILVDLSHFCHPQRGLALVWRGKEIISPVFCSVCQFKLGRKKKKTTSGCSFLFSVCQALEALRKRRQTSWFSSQGLSFFL